jgi:ribose-phosphate pyrophosphokinase
MAKLIPGTSNKTLAEAVAKILSLPITHCDISQFQDKEISIVINDNLADQDVFIIQSTSSPANDTLMELLFIADTARRSNAKSITAVIPYYGYGRQDKKIDSNGPISASCVAMLLEAVGINNIITVDLHSQHIEEFFRISVTNLCTTEIFAELIKNDDNAVIVSPDAGGIARARKISEYLNLPFILINKRRSKPGQCHAESIVGDVKDKVCYIIDDIVDTAGTLCSAADILMTSGAKEVHACVTHGVLSSGASERIEKSALKSLCISDSVDNSENVFSNKIKITSIAELIAKQMKEVLL